MLHDYVPFYFGERSPMLYAIHTGYVQGNDHGQRPIIYLASTVQAVAAQRNDWVFTNGHAIMAPLTQFFDQQAALKQVDWQTVHAQYWADTVDDPDRKRRKQAEFLVFRFFPFSLVTEIAVLDQQVAQYVQGVLSNAGATVPIQIRPAWYY